MKERSRTAAYTCNFDELFGTPNTEADLDIHQSIEGCRLCIRRAPDLLLVNVAKEAEPKEEMTMSATALTTYETDKSDELRIWGANLDTHERSRFPDTISAYFRAEQFMKYALEYLDAGGRITHFDACWLWGTNFDAYHNAVEEGATPWEAAASTWTAKTLAKLGFSPEPVKIEELTPIDQPHRKARITARFPRLV